MTSTFIILVLFSCSTLQSEIIHEGTLSHTSHNRGLDIDNENFIIAGSKGNLTFLDLKGNELFHTTIDSAEDIRDVEILNENGYLFLNSGDKGLIWKMDADKKIRTVFDSSGVFLDGMAFWDDSNGIAYGDPIDGKFFIITTVNGGETWNTIDPEIIPFALPNEAGFAASGTGIQCPDNKTAFIGTGACDTARLFRTFDKGNSWDVVNTPMRAGESFGIYSMFFWSRSEGIIIGGSYLEKEENKNICYYTSDSGESWEDRSKGLGGYCSGIHGNTDASLIVATGRIGTYYTLDKGITWKTLIKDNYYSVKVTDSMIVLSGQGGKYKLIQYTL